MMSLRLKGIIDLIKRLLTILLDWFIIRFLLIIEFYLANEYIIYINFSQPNKYYFIHFMDLVIKKQHDSKRLDSADQL